MGAYFDVSQLTVSDRKQDAMNKANIIFAMFVTAALCGLGYWIHTVQRASDERYAQYVEKTEKWQLEREARNRAWDEKWREEYGEPIVIPQSWYVPPRTYQIVQAGMFQVETKALPDLPAVVYIPIGTALVVALGTLWVAFLAAIKRMQKKEDERDQVDREQTQVLKTLQITIESQPSVFERLVRDLRDIVDKLRK